MSQDPTTAEPTEPQPPLTGVTVLEVGVFMAAPFATMQLADLGAEVVKVEDPRAATRCGPAGRSWTARARRTCGSTATRSRSRWT